MDEILLRPHHALCIRFFEGKGYSGEFTEHMAKTIERLGQKGSCVALTDKEDEICKRCPNHLEKGCSQREKAEGYDGKVLYMTNVSYGERMEFERLRELVEERIMAQGKFEEICGDCQWAQICHKKNSFFLCKNHEPML